MLVSLIIVFREALEAGLIVGIVRAATQSVVGRGRWIAGGIAAAACLVAAFAAARPSGVPLAAHLVTLLSLTIAARTVARPRSRALAATAMFVLLVSGIPPVRADDPPMLIFRNHRFEPARIEVPAHVKFRLLVKNTDDTADEFESVELNREKLVTPGQTITVFLGPLDPGEYKFFGDFHQDTAQGVMVAK